MCTVSCYLIREDERLTSRRFDESIYVLSHMELQQVELEVISKGKGDYTSQILYVNPFYIYHSAVYGFKD